MKIKASNIIGIARRKLGDLSYNKQALALIAIVIFGVVIPLTWFKDGYIFATGDFFPPLDPLNAIRSSGFIWALRSGGEGAFLDPPFVVPFYVFWGFFKLLGLGPLATEKLWFIFLFLGAGLSMYYLASALLPHKRYVIAKLTAAVFYMVNPAIAPIGLFLNVGNTVGYAFTPLILALFITGLKKRKIKYAIFIALLSFFLLGNAISSVVVPATIVMLTGVYFILYIITAGRKEVLPSLSFSGKTIVLTILINLWWLPSVIMPFVSSSEAIALRAMDIGSISDASRHSSLLEVFRLLGRPTFLDGWGGQPYFPFAASYFTPALIIATYLIPIMAFSALLLRRRDNGILFLGISALISLFLAKALHPPLESINEAMYTHIPFFNIFRRPVGKFDLITALCYAPLIGVTVNIVYDFLRRNRKRVLCIAGRVLFIIAAAAVIFGSGWPMLTGDVLLPDRGVLGKTYVKVPSYWLEAAQWINEQDEDSRVLLYPEPHQFGIMFDWGYYGWDISRRLIYKPYLANYGIFAGGNLENKGAFEITHFADEAIESGETANLMNLLALLNVRYILQRNDLNWDRYAMMGWDIDQPQHTRSVLSSQEGIHFERSFGELDLYRVDDDYFIPHIYAANDFIYAYGKLESLASRDLSSPAIFLAEAVEQSNNIQPEDFVLTLKGTTVIDSGRSNIIGDQINCKFLVPEAGKYDIVLKGTPHLMERNLEITIDGMDFNIEGNIKQGSYLLRNIELSQGTHSFSIPLQSGNAISDPGFEAGVWGGAVDVTPDASGIASFSAEQSTDAYEGSHSLKLTTDRHSIVVRAVADNFVPGALYSFRVKYKYINGAAPSLVIWEEGVEQVTVMEESLLYEEGEWMNYGTNFVSNPDATGLKVYLRAGTPHEGGEVLYDNVALIMLPSGLQEILMERSDGTFQSPTITYEKYNNTKYQVDVKDSQFFFLVFSESYNSQWKAYINPEGEDTNWIKAVFKKPLPEDKHFKVNGYANAWYIDSEELGMAGKDFTVTIYYKPQSLFYLGMIVSGLTLVVLIVCLVRGIKPERKKGTYTCYPTA